MYLLGAIDVFRAEQYFPVRRSARWASSTLLRTGTNPGVATTLDAAARLIVHGSRRQPRVPGRGLHHRAATGCAEFCRRRAGLGTAGSAADLFPRAVPAGAPAGRAGRSDGRCWPARSGVSIVRPIAVGGMLVGASYTLFKMRKQLIAGYGHALFRDLKKSARRMPQPTAPNATCLRRPFSPGSALCFMAMIALYLYFIAVGRQLVEHRRS